jgi:HSP20 family protein
MSDQMINQRPADQPGGIEERGLARRSEPRGLTRYQGYSSPFELMRRFSEDVDRMFSSFGFGNLGPFERTGRELTFPSTMTGMTTWAPSVDVLTRGDDLLVRADLPGIKPEDVHVEIEGNNLIIRGETSTEQKKEDQGYFYSERRYGSFYRTIPLPEGVKADNAQARFNNGVLEITLPGVAKTLQSQRRSIPVQGAGQQSQQGQTGTQTQSRQEQTTR